MAPKPDAVDRMVLLAHNVHFKNTDSQKCSLHSIVPITGNIIYEKPIMNLPVKNTYLNIMLSNHHYQNQNINTLFFVQITGSPDKAHIH